MEPGSMAPPFPIHCEAHCAEAPAAPLCELGLDQVPDQTPIALFRSAFSAPYREARDGRPCPLETVTEHGGARRTRPDV
jgi:hypothetical protein